MRNPESSKEMKALEPRWSGVSQNGRKMLLLSVALLGAISVLLPRISSQSKIEISFLPQLLNPAIHVLL